MDESEAVPNIPLVPDEELDAMKIKISQMKNDIQREKVTADGAAFPMSSMHAASQPGDGMLLG